MPIHCRNRQKISPFIGEPAIQSEQLTKAAIVDAGDILIPPLAVKQRMGFREEPFFKGLAGLRVIGIEKVFRIINRRGVRTFGK